MAVEEKTMHPDFCSLQAANFLLKGAVKEHKYALIMLDSESYQVFHNCKTREEVLAVESQLAYHLHHGELME